MENKRALVALQAKDLSVGRRGQALLSGVNFTLQPGSSLAVIGESGCGKTTLLQTLAGVLPAVAGDVSCRSSESAGKPVNAIVWQNLALFPWLTVAGNLALPLKLKKEYGIAERVREMLAELELEGLERRFPAALSGGQRQRLALGRALIAKPDVLFMDEPFSALDAVLREHLQHFLKQLRERHPCTMVFVTHDIGEAVYLGQHIMLLGARPSRVAAFGANPSFTDNANVDVRGTDAFYAVQRRLHNAVAAVRAGQELHLTDGAW